MSNVMNAEMLSMMVEKIDDSERIEAEACANDALCKEAWAVWDFAREVSRESEKVSEIVPRELTEVFEAVYNLSKSVGALSDQCCKLLSPIFENSPAYQDAVKSRYDRLMENSGEELAA